MARVHDHASDHGRASDDAPDHAVTHDRAPIVTSDQSTSFDSDLPSKMMKLLAQLPVTET